MSLTIYKGEPSLLRLETEKSDNHKFHTEKKDRVALRK